VTSTEFSATTKHKSSTSSPSRFRASVLRPSARATLQSSTNSSSPTCVPLLKPLSFLSRHTTTRRWAPRADRSTTRWGREERDRAWWAKEGITGCRCTTGARDG
jgi:hypothetical protein